LGYAKGDSGWLLLARHQTHLDSTRERVGSGEEEPLLQAAREVRIAAIEAFPLLASELQRKAEAALDTIRNAIRNADKLQQ
jgi:hypothetical protein